MGLSAFNNGHTTGALLFWSSQLGSLGFYPFPGLTITSFSKESALALSYKT